MKTAEYLFHFTLFQVARLFPRTLGWRLSTSARSASAAVRLSCSKETWIQQTDIVRNHERAFFIFMHRKITLSCKGMKGTERKYRQHYQPATARLRHPTKTDMNAHMYSARTCAFTYMYMYMYGSVNSSSLIYFEMRSYLLKYTCTYMVKSGEAKNL